MANEEVGTGYVLIKPKMDDDAVADVEKKGKKGGKGFAEEFKIAAGVLIADAVKTIASEAVNVFSNAFSNYADYEQLVGGVETLFKESADVVQRNASMAYATAGLSANEYMEQVTSFSASLISSLGGDTKAAASAADRAIVDMADNVNKMGSSMESVQNAYQGFAKQNYTMLDNLKLGYGGTQQEMQRLIKDAAAMTDVQEKLGVTVDASSMSFDNVVNAISVMQDHLGIAGATASEASTTISGSIAMLQASWQNFITGLFDSNADLETLVVQLFDSLGAVIKNVFPALANLVSNLFNTLPGIVDNALESIPEIIGPTLENVFGVEIGGKVIDAVSGVISFIKDVVAPTVEWAMDLIIPVVEKIAEAVFDAMPAIQSIIKNVMDDVKTVISGVWPAIEAIVVGAVNIIKFAIQGLDVVIGVVKSIFQTVKDAIENPMESAKNFIEGIIDAIKGLFNFDIQWPHIPLPHFSVSGSPNPLDWLSGGLPSINVEWYAKGGIVDGATLIGAGEAGPEAIVPLSEPNLRPFADAVAERMGAGIVVNEMTVVTPDPEDFMRQLTAFAARTRAQYA